MSEIKRTPHRSAYSRPTAKVLNLTGVAERMYGGKDPMPPPTGPAPKGSDKLAGMSDRDYVSPYEKLRARMAADYDLRAEQYEERLREPTRALRDISGWTEDERETASGGFAEGYAAFGIMPDVAHGNLQLAVAHRTRQGPMSAEERARKKEEDDRSGNRFVHAFRPDPRRGEMLRTAAERVQAAQYLIRFLKDSGAWGDPFVLRAFLEGAERLESKPPSPVGRPIATTKDHQAGGTTPSAGAAALAARLGTLSTGR